MTPEHRKRVTSDVLSKSSLVLDHIAAALRQSHTVLQGDEQQPHFPDDPTSLDNDMEFPEHVRKEIREFVRAAQLVLRKLEAEGCSFYEFLIVRSHLARLTARILQREASERLRESKNLLAPPRS
jgi:hypothetical protein